jgi:hypothetical protein
MKAQRGIKIGFNIKIGKKNLEMIFIFQCDWRFLQFIFQHVLDNYFVACLL